MRSVGLVPMLLIVAAAATLFPASAASVQTLPVTSGLKLWLSARSLTGLADGAAVSAWPDLSGNGLDVSQSDPALQPTYVADGAHGVPALRFSGNQFLIRRNVLGSSLTSYDQATAFFVERQSSPDTHNTVLGWVEADQNRFLFHTASYGLYLIFQSGDCRQEDNNVWWNAPQGWIGRFHIAEFTKNGTIFDCRVDGWHIGTTSGAGGPNLGVAADLYVGGDVFGNCVVGDIAEIVVYDRYLSESERTAVRAYLLTEYAWGGHYMPIRSAEHPVAAIASANVRFTFSGSVTILDGDSFKLDDGSGSFIKVVAPGYAGITGGDHVRATGVLDATTDPPTLRCVSSEITKVP